MAIGPQLGRALRTGFFPIVICSFWAGSLQSQTIATPQPDSANTSSYEVVSIRPDHSGIGVAVYKYSPNGLDSINLPLRSLLADAYGIPFENQISGLPGWANSEHFDVQARVDARTAEAWKKLSTKQIAAQQQPMLQSLLAVRCQLKAHLETRETPVYDLVIARRGLKMKEAPAEDRSGGMIRDGSFTGKATPIELLVANLTAWSGRLVIDKTGLAGKRFDFELEWAPDTTAANAGPSIFTALDEQLGLKLVPSKAPVQVLVIDHIERPSPN